MSRLTIALIGVFVIAGKSYAHQIPDESSDQGHFSIGMPDTSVAVSEQLIASLRDSVENFTDRCDLRVRLGDALWERQKKVRRKVFYLEKRYEPELRLGEAIDVYQEAFDKCPEDSSVVSHLIKASFADKRFDDCVELCTSMIAKYPGDWNYVRRLGFAYEQLGRLDKAVEQYARLVELKPIARNRELLATVLAAVGRLAEAAEQNRLAGLERRLERDR